MVLLGCGGLLAGPPRCQQLQQITRGDNSVSIDVLVLALHAAPRGDATTTPPNIQRSWTGSVVVASDAVEPVLDDHHMTGWAIVHTRLDGVAPAVNVVVVGDGIF